MSKVVVIGCGFAGLQATKAVAENIEVEVTLIDQRNHHLFQPLLYQVATAALNPANIAMPIRSLMAKYENVRVLNETVTSVDLKKREVVTNYETHTYDYLVMALGAVHCYFGHEEWETFAPGLKTERGAMEIRNRILSAFEIAERDRDRDRQQKYLTFAVVGGGPTGVELAGALAEFSHVVLRRDFRNIHPEHTRVVLIQGGDRILPMFSQSLTERATRDLEKMGVEVMTGKRVTGVDADGVVMGDERLEAATVIWAAGVQASKVNETLGVELDRQGRVVVQPDLSLKDYPEVFVVGDQSHCEEKGQPLPGVATVALQEGYRAGKNILASIEGGTRKPYKHFDRGKAATIGKSKAIVEVGPIKVSGFFAWLIWLFIHIWFLVGFENRLLVIMQWAWYYIFHCNGARVIMSEDWRSYPEPAKQSNV